MSKLVMERSAADNKYLHMDFHGALSTGLDYIAERFGSDAVREYLRDFTLTYYAPLIQDMRNRGLAALRDYFEKLYAKEGGTAEIVLEKDRLIINVDACPAVMHLRNRGYTVSPLFVETTATVNAALCEDTEFAFRLEEYEPQTGKSRQVFYRKECAA